MRKLSISFLLCSAIAILVIFSLNAFATEPIKVFIDGQQINFNIQPIEENGTTLVEFRPIFEKLGLIVGWDQATETVTGSKDNLVIKLKIGSKAASVNGQSIELLLPTRVVNDHTLVPIRFIGEATGAIVTWNSITSSIDITTPAKKLQEIKQVETYIELLKQMGDIFKQNEVDTTMSLDEYKANSINLTYSILARETEKYVGTKVHLKGKVVQVIENGFSIALRVNITKNKYGSYSDTIYVNYNLKPDEKRFLDNDIVEIWGEVKGRKTYTAIFGQSVTLPEINAREIEILTI